MAIQLSQYEDVGQAFLKAHPVGTVVPPDQLLEWVRDHGDGIKSDLLVDNVGKQISSIRRHLNMGGASRALAEARRFYVDVHDAKRKTFIIRTLSEHVNQQAELAFGKSVMGAINPLKQSERAINDLKREELSEAERQALETKLEELVEMATPVRKLLNDKVVERWVHRLEAAGYSPKQARDLIEFLPMLQRELKLIKATS